MPLQGSLRLSNATTPLDGSECLKMLATILPANGHNLRGSWTEHANALKEWRGVPIHAILTPAPKTTQTGGTMSNALSTDPFIAIRTKLADQAANRARLAEHAEQVTYWTTAHVGYVPQDYCTADSLANVRTATDGGSYYVRACATLRARRNRNAKVAHGWDVATDCKPMDVRTLHAVAAIDREYRLTREARNVVRMVRDHEARGACVARGDLYPLGTTWKPSDAAVDVLAAIDAKTPGSSRAWKGIIPTTETRVNVRGAGLRGLKVQPGKQVTTRDHRVPTWALRDLKTVGLATVPGVTVWGAETVTELTNYVRRDRKRATVRTWLPTYDVSTKTMVLRDTVIPADDYAPADGLDRAERTQSHAVRAGLAQREADLSRQRMDMSALAERGVIGYLGNIE
jgi:hypothetical protein